MYLVLYVRSSQILFSNEIEKFWSVSKVYVDKIRSISILDWSVVETGLREGGGVPVYPVEYPTIHRPLTL